MVRMTDWENDHWRLEQVELLPNAVVIVEGCFLFTPLSTGVFDLAIWIDLALDHVVERAVRRPVTLRVWAAKREFDGATPSAICPRSTATSGRTGRRNVRISSFQRDCRSETEPSRRDREDASRGASREPQALQR